MAGGDLGRIMTPTIQKNGLTKLEDMALLKNPGGRSGYRCHRLLRRRWHIPKPKPPRKARSPKPCPRYEDVTFPPCFPSGCTLKPPCSEKQSQVWASKPSSSS